MDKHLHRTIKTADATQDFKSYGSHEWRLFWASFTLSSAGRFVFWITFKSSHQFLIRSRLDWLPLYCAMIFQYASSLDPRLSFLWSKINRETLWRYFSLKGLAGEFVYLSQPLCANSRIQVRACRYLSPNLCDELTTLVFRNKGSSRAVLAGDLSAQRWKLCVRSSFRLGLCLTHSPYK